MKLFYVLLPIWKITKLPAQTTTAAGGCKRFQQLLMILDEILELLT